MAVRIDSTLFFDSNDLTLGYRRVKIRRYRRKPVLAINKFHPVGVKRRHVIIDKFNVER